MATRDVSNAPDGDRVVPRRPGHGRRACCVGRRLSAIVSRGGSDAASDIAARRGGGWIWDRKWRARILPDKSRYGEGLAYRDMADGALVIVIGVLARRTRPAIRGLGWVS